MYPASSVVASMNTDTVYKIMLQGDKIRRTVTGKFIAQDGEKVILQDKAGRFQNMPISRIIYITYFKENPF